MTKWGVSIQPPGPRMRGWRIGRPRVRQGWDTGRQGSITSFPDPNPGQYRAAIGINGAFEAANVRQPAVGQGFTKWRFQFTWSEIQPTNATTYVWDRYDAVMTTAAREGCELLALLAYSAPWASSQPAPVDANQKFWPPTNASDYANFCAAVVNRYGPGGSFWASHPNLVPAPILAVELWNEPWLTQFWRPQPDPAAYASLALAGATAVRAAKPTVKILVSGDLFQSRTDGLPQQLFGPAVFTTQPSLSGLVDAVALHPYTSSVAQDPLDESHNVDQSYWGKALEARDRIRLAAGRSIPIWFTECGWTTATGASNGVTESAAATYTNHLLGRTLQLNGAATDYHAAIERIYYFKYDRSLASLTDPEAQYGLLRQDGTAKPALAELIKYL